MQASVTSAFQVFDMEGSLGTARVCQRGYRVAAEAYLIPKPLPSPASRSFSLFSINGARSFANLELTSSLQAFR